MAIFGEYETVYELYRHGLGAVARAKVAQAEGGEPNFIVKTFHPPHRIAGSAALQPAIREFLDRVRIQQDLCSSGASHWVPVYGAGAVGKSAYYVTAYYPRSAQKLISSRVKLSAAGLHALVSGVIRGLLEMKDSCGRAHGNLKPSNILIEGEGEVEHSKIVLTDPAPAGEGSIGGGDLSALGELICQLVLHRLFRGSQNWPINPSPEWTRLGRKGKAWRELCNRLLAPEGTAGLTLESVAEEVEALRPRKAWISPGRAGLLVGTLLLAVGVFVGVQYMRFRSEWRELCSGYSNWVYRFQTEAKASPERLQRFRSDPYIRGATEGLLSDDAQFDPKRIAGNDLVALSALADRPPMSWGAMRQTRKALQAVRQTQTQLAPDRWPLLKELAEYRKLCQKRGWETAARRMDELIEATQPGPDRNVAAAVDALLTSQAKLRQDLAVIEDRWQVIGATQKEIAQKASDDAVLRQFDAFQQRAAQKALAGGGRNPVAAVAELRAAIVPVADLASQISEVLQSDWSGRVDRQRFAQEAEVYRTIAAAAANSADADNFREWLREVQDYYKYRVEPQMDVLAKLGEETDRVGIQIEAKRKSGGAPKDQIAAWNKRLSAARATIESLPSKSWVQKDRRTGGIEKVAADVRAALEQLRTEASGATVVATPLEPVKALMAAKNGAAPFKLNLVAKPYISQWGNGECTGVTVTPDRDCYVIVVCQDSAGELSLLLPNTRCPEVPILRRGQPVAVHELGNFELYPQPPYGRTVLKVIGSTKRINLVGATPNEQTHAMENIEGFSVGAGQTSVNVSDLLRADEWTTAETEWVTKAPAGAAGADARGNGGDGGGDAHRSQ
jgi:hypothetical protein